MKDSIAHKAAKVSAYILGVALLLIGIVSLGIQIELGNTESHTFSSYLFEVVFIICGLFTCLATRMKIRGGLLTALGIDFMGFGFISTASIIVSHLQNLHTIYSGAFYFRVVAFWIVGCICLVLALRRHDNNQHIKDGAA